MIADRLKGLEPSGIRKIFDKAQTAVNPIDLIMGEPDFDIPENIKEAGIAAIRAGRNKYTPTAGIPPLRKALREQLQAEGVLFDDVMVTAGVSGGLLLSSLALINPGDEVIIPDPFFVMYRYVVSMCGGIPVLLDTYPDFHPDEARLRSLITPHTKIIIINSPNNPTGAVYTESELRAIAEIAREHNLIVISDEIYDKFLYDRREHFSIGKVYPLTVTLKGFAKSYGMTGWRLGYAAGPGEIIRSMTILQQYSFTCASSVAQHAVLDAFNTDISRHIREYQIKRDLVYDGLKDKYQVNRPEGAFYIFPEAGGLTSEEFLNRALERNLFIIPGDAFSGKNTHFRISFAAPKDRLEKGIEILRQLV